VTPLPRFAAAASHPSLIAVPERRSASGLGFTLAPLGGALLRIPKDWEQDRTGPFSANLRDARSELFMSMGRYNIVMPTERQGSGDLFGGTRGIRRSAARRGRIDDRAAVACRDDEGEA